jgi:putative intracellular protease/amidase
MNRPKTKTILFALSSVDELGTSGKSTGTWLHELAAPYYLITEAGHNVVFASPKGGMAPIDLLSMSPLYTSPFTDRFLQDELALCQVRSTRQLADVHHEDLDALLVPGGYGLFWDLASDLSMLRLTNAMYEAQKPVAMVCHAPAILRDLKRSTGEYLVSGKNLTVFKIDEDEEIEMGRYLPFQPEEALKARGAHVLTAGNWVPHVVVDYPLITGQSPPSAVPMTLELLKHL